MERMRPPMVSELLLSNDGDRILEGSVTNFFVVCKEDRVASCVHAWAGSSACIAGRAPIQNSTSREAKGRIEAFLWAARSLVVVGDKADDSTYDLEKAPSFVVQTAPLSDGVLPGVIRQLVIE
ncbi:hypothetical protein MA16_Dca015515 [Dendrobium catenatum]|uniref:Uncharacterized protein n=1 Tax=Dendrobium catenatum TaxID=906689 RepID=A0A2I0WHL6_9ASPA|nr:hypothetical protein MA16_Dca015515 [Dendrobium catenatum]